jgi:hypothetical protein
VRKLAVVALFVLPLASCSLLEGDAANQRVTRMMLGWAEGGENLTVDVQTAIAQWYEGAAFIPERDVLGQASMDFNAWRREKNLNRKIESWEIVSVTAEPETDPPVSIVSVTIEGEPYAMRVQEGQPIEWAN